MYQFNYNSATSFIQKRIGEKNSLLNLTREKLECSHCDVHTDKYIMGGNWAGSDDIHSDFHDDHDY